MLPEDKELLMTGKSSELADTFLRTVNAVSLQPAESPRLWFAQQHPVGALSNGTTNQQTGLHVISNYLSSETTLLHDAVE